MLFPKFIFVSSLLLARNSLADTKSGTSGDGPVAQIDVGKLKGIAYRHNDSGVTVKKFLGIPFAKPPVKDLRFSPPAAVEPWSGVLDAQQQPNACIQYHGPHGRARDMTMQLFSSPPPPGESEDCLYLNVYAPESGEGNKSVLFWIHGGSGTSGAASLPLYEGTNFAARQDVVVVATNYRLNVFGAPGSPHIPADENNVYQLDIRAALDWTTRNIAAFGGDPNKVTIMGESAGAISVGDLVNTMPDNPPFRAAIEMSGSSVIAPQDIVNSGDKDEQWPTLMKFLNCSNEDAEKELRCARGIDAKKIQNIMDTNALPVYVNKPDNKTALEHPGEAWSKGKVAKVPLLIGSTGDDASFFTHLKLQAASAAADLPLNTTLEKLLGVDKKTAEILSEAYKIGGPFAEGANTTEGIISRIATDFTFRCSSAFVANLTATGLDVPVWQYAFKAIVPTNTWEEWPFLGAYHASELAVLFGTYAKNDTSAIQDALSRSMQKQFGDFIKDPNNGPGWDQWPKVGVLNVDRNGPTTEAKPGSELDRVCQFYHPLFLKALPALANTSSTGSTSSGLGNNGQGDGNAEPHGSQGAGVAKTVSPALAGAAVLRFIASL